MMEQRKNEPMTPMGVSYRGALRKAKKSSDPLAPVFEAFTNALEAIEDTKETEGNGRIVIRIRRDGALFSEGCTFDSIRVEVEDDGRGFTDEDFRRFLTLDDSSKGRNNKGIGRLQYVLTFDETEFSSYFQQDGQTFVRRFIASMKESFLNKNTIVSGGSVASPCDPRLSGTLVTFRGIRNANDKKFFEKLTLEELKTRFLDRYLVRFHYIRSRLPKIILEEVVTSASEDTVRELEITARDVPKSAFKEKVSFQYSKFERRGESQVKVESGTTQVKGTVEGFVLDVDAAPSENKIEFVCKGETVKKSQFGLLKKDDVIDKKQFVVYVSGDFVDERVGEDRYSFDLPTKREVKKKIKNDEVASNSEILTLDSVLAATRETCLNCFPGLRDKEKELKERLKELQRIYLFDDSVLDKLEHRVSSCDSDEEILRKIYRHESTNDARFDEKIQRQLTKVRELDPSDGQYAEKLNELTVKVAQEIPQRNRATLTKHVFRRNVVLKLFEMTLNNQLAVQESGGKIDEGRLHDLIFPRKGDNPYQSDLWILNEEYVYFSGTSDKQFRLIEANGKRIFDDNLPSEELDYLHCYGEKREEQRPDVLLFPEEQKCILVEFKQPDVNVSSHLDQIQRYATFLRNYTKEEFQFDKFYGYLIGENFSIRDIVFHNSDFFESEAFGFAFRPSKRIIGLKERGRTDGSLYMEITRYSSILARAQKRHTLFNEILTKRYSEDADEEKSPRKENAPKQQIS